MRLKDLKDILCYQNYSATIIEDSSETHWSERVVVADINHLMDHYGDYRITSLCGPGYMPRVRYMEIVLSKE